MSSATIHSLTRHVVRQGDARNLGHIRSESVHLVCTSPPYFSLKRYPDHDGQLGNIASYERFLDELDLVWGECLRILVPGGRIACVAGDVCISRRAGGRHHVLPLSADIQVRARKLGFDCLTPIRWVKVANIRLEASRSARYLGRPNLPNGVIKNDVDSILFFRKPGGYRKPTAEMERRSRLESPDYMRWFAPLWTDVSGQPRCDHPAPFPLELARRLVRMFSFADDIVVDPFAGSGTTALAALECGRHSISVELEPSYIELIEQRLAGLGRGGAVRVERPAPRLILRRPGTVPGRLILRRPVA
jgi:site-specific DNA-methyltransferase (adenine-specific)